MAEEQTPAAPGPPAGIQRPGIPGAGNLLDPEVRAELREQVHAAVPAGMHPRPGNAAPPAAPQTAPPPGQHRAGPFPHGDVDLSGFAANVPAGPIRPRRGRVRSYYFLTQAADTTDEEPPPPAIQPPPGPKPG
jgi:hypothetical protein